MSENEKKRRASYKKNRDKVIFVQTVIVVILTLAVLISAIVAFNLNREYYVNYTEGGSIDYNVFLKENEFYEENYLGQGQSYVASLIDNIIADFNYRIKMDADDVNYRYSYKITSRLEIIDNMSKNAIFNPEYVLVEANNKIQQSDDTLQINEIVVINYDEYNDIANRFLETYALAKDATSNIVVTLDVEVFSDCNALSGSSMDNYTSELRIPLTTKTVNIKMTSTVPDDETNMMICTRGAGSEVFKTTAIVLGIVDILMIILLVAFIYLTRTDDITYTARVKKIVTQYKSYIQKIKNIFDTSSYQVVYIDTFDELLEIRDTIQAPILMHENEDKTCAKFIIPTDNKLLYIFEIKIDGYEEPELPKTPEPTPTTIVKPNITNVVRPVVKVVLSKPEQVEKTEEPATEEEATIETVYEEPEIEADDEIVPLVIADFEDDLIEEDVETVETVDAEETEEEETVEEPEEVKIENGVEVIDVIISEGESERSYRYDPDGNAVAEGDVVLVPARDNESDKEVVREAEVSKGNYLVAEEEIESPLRKIIGVVRRRAEKVFTAMIAPDEETMASDADDKD